MPALTGVLEKSCCSVAKATWACWPLGDSEGLVTLSNVAPSPAADC